MANFSGFAKAGLQMGLQSILVKPQRGFSNILLDDKTKLPDFKADVTIEERHSDRLEITEHPVEQGAAIADHAFKRPAHLTITLAWSNSPVGSGSLMDAAVGALAANSSVGRQIANVVTTATAVVDVVQSVLNGADPGQINGVYQAILLLQSSRALFDVYTGKRAYKNMVCVSLNTETSDKTANSLILTMECHQVILVDTKVTLINKDVQKEPEKTAPPVDEGGKNAELVSQEGTVTETGKITSGTGNVYNADGTSSADGTAGSSTRASRMAEMKF